MPLPLLSPILPTGQRELAVLRVLGRLGPTLGTALHELLFPDQDETTRNRLLTRLTEQKLLWRVFVASSRRDDDGRCLGGPSYAYGLTTEGKETLDFANAEPHDGTYGRLLARSRQAPSAPSTPNLMLDVYISSWCASLLDQVRRVPSLVGVHVQRRFAVIDKTDKTLQTIGAVIILAFDKTTKTFDQYGWELPWLSLGTTPDSWTYQRLALEIDTGQTPLRTLFDLARMYQRLTDANAYSQLFGGPVRPVIITPSGRRARGVAEIWSGAWPNSPTLLSTYERTDHPVYGPLWGEYRSIATLPSTETTLLSQVLGTVAQWPALSSQWSPTMRPADDPPSGSQRPAA